MKYLVAALCAACSITFAASIPKSAGAVSPKNSAKAAEAPTASDKRAVEILDQISKRFSSVTTAYAKFDQVKENHTFNEKSATQGEMWYQKPDRFRCEYTGKNESDRLTNLITNNTLYVGLPHFKQVERYPFENSVDTKRQLDRILLGFGLATQEILKSYKVSLLEENTAKQTAQLRFVPTFQDNYGIDYIVIVMDLKNARPINLQIQEGEDRTTITIRDFKLNPKIDSKKFAVDFPKNWELIDKV